MLIQPISGIHSPRLYQPSRPVRNPQYRAFIRRLPCVACGSTRRVEAAHTGPHGIGQKASDLQTIPLCPYCHQKFDANQHGFAEHTGFSVPALVMRLNQFWFEKLNGGAA